MTSTPRPGRLSLLLLLCGAAVACATAAETAADADASAPVDAAAPFDLFAPADLAPPPDLPEEPDVPGEPDVVDAEDVPSREDLSPTDIATDGALDTIAGEDGVDPPSDPLVVNSLEDLADPPPGVVTLRSALAAAPSGHTITFDPRLDGGTIALSIVGEAHTILKGEVMGMRDEPSGPVSYLVGYFERDYGPSALYARKDVAIDAGDLPSGITFAWTGGDENPARVLAVYGDLHMGDVTVTGGRSVAEPLPTNDDPAAQPWTLARGGGVAVWGDANLSNCTLHDNHCEGDFESSRDRGAFGGGLYADMVRLRGCTVSGNTVVGGGAAGGGVFAVGGAESYPFDANILQSAVTGNRIRGLFTYGGGVFSDGGGIGNAREILLESSTIARNVVEPAPGLPPFLLTMGYWRGGGVYMSNGHLEIRSCTIAENEVYGVPRTDALGKPNLAGGVAATIGNAHAVEDMRIGQSIIAGNRVIELGPDGVPARDYAHDVFTGSLLHFHSTGYNLLGVVDFSQILVPVGEEDWDSFCRKHFPEVGDSYGVAVADVLDLENGRTIAEGILSAGVEEGLPAVLAYAPRGVALDRVPPMIYSVDGVHAEYALADGATNDFLAILLARLEAHYELNGFAATFTADFEAFLAAVDLDGDTPELEPYTDPEGTPILTLADTQWFGPRETWPKELPNYPYILFWRRLDEALQAEAIDGMGPELLGDDAWLALFASGPLAENADITMTVEPLALSVTAAPRDQFDTVRTGHPSDIGAVELP